MCIRDRYIEGQLSTRKWKDEKTGTDKYSTEILIQGFNSSLTMLGGPGQGGGSSSQENKKIDSNNDIAQNDLDDEIPF